MTNAQAKKEVREYCKCFGLSLNAKDNIPMISNKELSMIECFDNWIKARDFLIKLKYNH